MEALLTFFDLCWPVALSFTLMAIQFLIHADDNDKAHLSVTLGPINLGIPIAHIIILRIVLALGSLALLVFPAFRDYTEYFPTEYKMRVFFDDKGLRESLAQFSEREVALLNIKGEWEADKESYLASINDYLARERGIPFTFGIDSGYVHSKGYTTFNVSKIKGWQRYYIYGASGELEHILEAPGKTTIRFRSEFILLETANNFIDVSIGEIYVLFTKVIRPMFKQVIRVSPTNEEYHHTLSAITKIRFFPVIDVGHTVYFVQWDNGTIVPIGYCIYQPQ